MLNQLVMVIAQLINLNVSCKLHLYSLQRKRLLLGPCLPRMIVNMHPHNYSNLKGKDIDVHFFFLSRGIILWIELPWPENPAISSGGDHGIHCWWDLIRSKQLSSVSICRAQVFARFSGHGNLIHNIISLLKKMYKKSSLWVSSLVNIFIFKSCDELYCILLNKFLVYLQQNLGICDIKCYHHQEWNQEPKFKFWMRSYLPTPPLR